MIVSMDALCLLSLSCTSITVLQKTIGCLQQKSRHAFKMVLMVKKQVILSHSAYCVLTSWQQELTQDYSINNIVYFVYIMITFISIIT